MYLYAVIGLFVVAPLVSILIEWFARRSQRNLAALALKWFAFWAVGVRLFTAGLRQTIQPSFTANDVFGIDDPVVWPFVQELGFANISMGLLGMASLFAPSWRQPTAFIGAVFFGIAGVRHIIAHEAMTDMRTIAMISDLGIAAVLGVLVVATLRRA